MKNSRYKKIKNPLAILEQEEHDILRDKFGADIAVEDDASFSWAMNKISKADFFREAPQIKSLGTKKRYKACPASI